MKPFKRLMMTTIAVTTLALVVACSPQTGEPEAAETGVPTTPDVMEPTEEMEEGETPAAETGADAASAAAVAQLAAELEISEAEIEVVSVEATEFSDSCLGLGGAAESCLQAITPGWLVMLSAAGQTYEVHTDETAQQVRIASGSASAADPDAATAAAVAYLAGELGVAEGEIELVSLEGAEFSDSCLGLGQADESCLQAITPGWLIMLGAEGQVYELHTDETGQQVRLSGAVE